MLVFCLTCKEPVVLTSTDFKVGGPYHGGMFKPMSDDRWKCTMFDCRPHVKGGDLHCPRCMAGFISPHGRLLTEHGIVYPGQPNIDTSQCIVHQEGPMRGNLMHIKDSLVVSKDLVKEAAERRQAEMDAAWGVSKLDEVEPGQATINKALRNTLEDDLKCAKCGRQYKDAKWRDKHQAKCKG